MMAVYDFLNYKTTKVTKLQNYKSNKTTKLQN